ncbi:MAG: helix-turn-helix domain-containing protein [Thermodesulfobacteriota bacterium]
MLEHTKKPLTDNVELCFTGPAARKEEAVRRLVELGFSVRDGGESAPWREAFPFKDEEMPGVFLAGARYREGLTQEALAKAAGIPRRHISEMENGKRPIGKQNARKLGEALHVDPRRFLTA